MKQLYRGKRMMVGLIGMAVFLPLFGCGGRGSVEGSLSVADQPVTKGALITFIASSGETAQAQVRDDGRFTAENVPTGQLRVLVVNAPLPPRSDQPLPPPPKRATDPPIKSHIKIGNQVPNRYQNRENGVVVHIHSGKNQIKLNLDP